MIIFRIFNNHIFIVMFYRNQSLSDQRFFCEWRVEKLYLGSSNIYMKYYSMPPSPVSTDIKQIAKFMIWKSREWSTIQRLICKIINVNHFYGLYSYTNSYQLNLLSTKKEKLPSTCVAKIHEPRWMKERRRRANDFCGCSAERAEETDCQMCNLNCKKAWERDSRFACPILFQVFPTFKLLQLRCRGT